MTILLLLLLSDLGFIAVDISNSHGCVEQDFIIFSFYAEAHGGGTSKDCFFQSEKF